MLRDTENNSDVPNWSLKERSGVIAGLSLAQCGVYGAAGVGVRALTMLDPGQSGTNFLTIHVYMRRILQSNELGG